MMMMMMSMIPGTNTYGTNTYRYSFRRYFGCMPGYDDANVDANDDDDTGGAGCAGVESVALLEWPDSCREKWRRW